MASIGGAGTFDGIVLSGLVATLLVPGALQDDPVSLTWGVGSLTQGPGAAGRATGGRPDISLSRTFLL